MLTYADVCGHAGEDNMQFWQPSQEIWAKRHTHAQVLSLIAYWYKSTNTHAEGAESTHYALNYALLISLASVALLVQKYKYGR